TGRRPIFGSVPPVRAVDEIGVVRTRLVVYIQQVEPKPDRAGGHRAAAARDVEEILFGEFPGVGGVRDEARLDPLLLAAQTLQGEEEEGLRKLPLDGRHAGRHVEPEHHHGVGGPAWSLLQLTEAQVVIDEWHGLRLDRAPLHRFLDREPPVEPRADAALADAFAHDLVLVDGSARLGFEIGQLELLPQPVDEIIELELDHQLEFALAGTALAGLVARAGLRGSQDVADFSLALARAAFRLGIREPEPRMLEHAHRNPYGALGGIRDEVAAGE